MRGKKDLAGEKAGSREVEKKLYTCILAGQELDTYVWVYAVLWLLGIV